MNRSFDAGPIVLAVGGLLLIVSLFLSWYGDQSAFDVFESLDLVLLVCGLVALAVGFGRVGDDSRLGLAVAAGALLVVVVSLVNPPPAAGPSADISAGGWVGLVAAVIMVGGAASAVASFSVSVDVRGRERRRRVAAVDRRTERPQARPESPRSAPPEDSASSYTARRRSILEAQDEEQRTQAMPVLEGDEE